MFFNVNYTSVKLENNIEQPINSEIFAEQVSVGDT